MPDNSTNSSVAPQDGLSKSSNQSKPPASSSPWDEELPEAEPKKEQVVGTLGAQKSSNQTGTSKTAAFVVPSNIDANAGPKVVSSSNFPNAIANAVPGQPQNKPPAQAVAPAPGNVNNNQAVQPKPAENKEESPFTYGIDFSSSSPKTVVAEKETPITSVPPPPLAPKPSVPLVPSPNVPSTSLRAGPLSPTVGGVVDDIHSGKLGVNISANQPKVQISTSNNLPPQVNQTPPQSKPRRGIWPFAKKQSNPAPGKPASGLDSILGQSNPVSVEKNPIEEEKILDSAPSGKLKIFEYFAAGFAVLALIVFLTEFGIFSIGAEKVYGAIGLETLWGGLPIKSDKALAMSFIKMQDHPDFKIKGSLDLTIDKTKESDITTPLTLSYVPSYDKVTKAILAATDTSSDWNPSDWAVDGGASSNSLDTSTPSVSDPTATDSATSTPATTPAESTSSQIDQQSYQPYQSIGASTKDVGTTFDGFIGQTGNELKFMVNKAVGSSKINLKNLDDKLWVNSDSIVFGGNRDSTKWLESILNNLSGKSLSNEFLSAPDAGLSIKGTRKGSEKVGNVRCYKYEISDLTLGDSLSIFGIKSDTIQSISGNVWIGVRDKLVHKINVKVTLAPSYSITQLTLSADLYDYDTINNFAKVSSTEIYQPETTSVSTDTSTDSSTTVSSTSSSTETGDAKRKSDLALIQKSLELYKTDYFSYPTAPLLVKLNVANNIVEKLMVPGYINVLPKDPRDAEGWFYGYKSDGASFTLSARLENASDPAVVLTDGLSLYFLKNQ